jgi:ferredoxin-NADP reductase
MVTAFAAAGTLVAVGCLAIRWVRRHLPYELWHAMHMATYAILFLAYGHQFAMGTDLQSRAARSFWIGLYAVTAVAVLWGRVIAPARFNLRHRLRVASVVPETADTFSIYLEGRHLHRLSAQPGQFFRWRFLSAGGWWQSHPFSLSSAPNGHWLRLTVHAAGGYTRRLRQLPCRTRVLAAGPFGQFTAARRTRDLALFIAGGSGIAPIRALLEQMPHGSILIYRAGQPDRLVFRNELERLGAQQGVRVHYVVGRRTDPWPRWAFTYAGLTQLVPDVTERDVYLCGPTGLIRSAIVTLRYLGVPSRQIHLDPFEL